MSRFPLPGLLAAAAVRASRSAGVAVAADALRDGA